MNRRVRNRAPGGVGGRRGKPRLLPDGFLGSKAPTLQVFTYSADRHNEITLLLNQNLTASRVTDLWKPYLNVVAQYAKHVLNILDRLHIMKHMNEALDKARNQEIKSLKAKGKETILSGSK